MNFLAHYFFDRQAFRPYYSLGLLMPDLIRNFLHRHAVLPKVLEMSSSNVSDILYGYKRHLASDYVFHQCLPFVDFNKQITTVLRNSGVGFQRDWFLAHILTELMLDRALLLQNPDIGVTLYEELELCESAVINSFLLALNLTNFSAFENGFGRFKNARYLLTYSNTADIAYAMGRIASRLHINITEEPQQEVLMQIIHDFEDRFVSFIDQLKLLLT